jgi:hypothetical protein
MSVLNNKGVGHEELTLRRGGRLRFHQENTCDLAIEPI